MAGGTGEKPDDGWGDWLGHKTFLYTTIGTALFLAAVFIFIL